MRAFDELKEFVATKSGFKSWDSLLEEIKGDVDLIDFYVSCALVVQSEQVRSNLTLRDDEEVRKAQVKGYTYLIP